MRRRAFLATTVLALPLLAGCAVTTTNGVTTLTLNVAEVSSWGQAIVNSVGLILTLPGVSALLAPEADAVAAALAAASADLSAFDQASGGAVTVTFNNTSAGAAVSSLLADGQSVFSLFKNALGTELGTLGASVKTYLDALQTVVSLLSAAVSTGTGTSSAAAATLPMTEAQALAALRVKPAT